MRYFIGFLVSIGLIILLIVLLVGGGGSDKAKVPTTTKTLVSLANTDSTVRMTIDGPINAEQNHQQIRITVGKDDAVYEQISGYDGTVVDRKSFPNNANAYNNFLHALSNAGYTKGSSDKSLQDEKGVCPLGDRYIFEVIENNSDLQRFWATSCGKAKTYNGDRSLTSRLFKDQIPNYDSTVSAIQNFQL